MAPSTTRTTTSVRGQHDHVKERFHLSSQQAPCLLLSRLYTPPSPFPNAFDNEENLTTSSQSETQTTRQQILLILSVLQRFVDGMVALRDGRPAGDTRENKRRRTCSAPPFFAVTRQLPHQRARQQHTLVTSKKRKGSFLLSKRGVFLQTPLRLPYPQGKKIGRLRKIVQTDTRVYGGATEKEEWR